MPSSGKALLKAQKTIHFKCQTSGLKIFF